MGFICGPKGGRICSSCLRLVLVIRESFWRVLWIGKLLSASKGEVQAVFGFGVVKLNGVWQGMKGQMCYGLEYF